MRQRKETIDKRIADLFDYFRWIFDKYGFEYEAYKKEGKQTAGSFANYMISMEKVYQKDPAQRDQIITDYIAGMTDSYALSVMEDVILPNSIKFFS
jgi:dGTPase